MGAPRRRHSIEAPSRGSTIATSFLLTSSGHGNTVPQMCVAGPGLCDWQRGDSPSESFANNCAKGVVPDSSVRTG